eukprot:TRINITY_DN4667_c0_g1_i1.p1 TRINITY_DN4667_c0_g1~~TRINITY_DN4667_c0_g1_i1.p1  ORF type:complete len:189 (+),score=32.56 TRINITY_DN4667_c0_g1_i1:53-568(+)
MMSKPVSKLSSNHPIKEDVWQYPRPPAIERVPDLVQVFVEGKEIAHSKNSWRICETSHPPTYYIPPSDIKMEYLSMNSKSSYCEFKGRAGYYDLNMDGRKTKDVAWFYSNPTKQYTPIKDHLCFYASKVDSCFVDEEEVTPQQSDFYGGWITSWVTGGSKGMKGPKGTEWW